MAQPVNVQLLNAMLPTFLLSLVQETRAQACMQLLVIIWRTALTHFRSFYPTTVADMVILIGAAIVVGLVHGTGSPLQP
jgi:hypothetical protein